MTKSTHNGPPAATRFKNLRDRAGHEHGSDGRFTGPGGGTPHVARVHAAAGRVQAAQRAVDAAAARSRQAPVSLPQALAERDAATQEAIDLYHQVPGQEVTQPTAVDPQAFKRVGENLWLRRGLGAINPLSDEQVRDHFQGQIPGHDAERSPEWQQTLEQWQEVTDHLAAEFPDDVDTVNRTITLDEDITPEDAPQFRRLLQDGTLTRSCDLGGAVAYTVKQGVDPKEVLQTFRKLARKYPDLGFESAERLGSVDQAEHLFRILRQPELRYETPYGVAVAKPINGTFAAVHLDGKFRLLPIERLEAWEARVHQRRARRR